MFNVQGSEIVIILLLGLVVLGPEKLPEAMRRLGRFYADLKKMSTSFQDEFRAAVDAPTRELRETANTLRDSLDFRDLQAGERPEKSASARMAPADPAAVPTDAVPFRPDDTAEPPADVPTRQVAVDDEFGLRESRPVAGPQDGDA